jgi:hypothetical protein
MKKENELHITCACHTHELHFEKDHGYEMWYVSFWQRGYASDTSWKYRLKCIWHVLVHGRPYGDEVILEKKDMEELQIYINEQLKK